MFIVIADDHECCKITELIHSMGFNELNKNETKCKLCYIINTQSPTIRGTFASNWKRPNHVISLIQSALAFGIVSLVRFGFVINLMPYTTNHVISNRNKFLSITNHQSNVFGIRWFTGARKQHQCQHLVMRNISLAQWLIISYNLFRAKRNST